MDVRHARFAGHGVRFRAVCKPLLCERPGQEERKVAERAETRGSGLLQCVLGGWRGPAGRELLSSDHEVQTTPGLPDDCSFHVEMQGDNLHL